MLELVLMVVGVLTPAWDGYPTPPRLYGETPELDGYPRPPR